MQLEDLLTITQHWENPETSRRPPDSDPRNSYWNGKLGLPIRSTPSVNIADDDDIIQHILRTNGSFFATASQRHTIGWALDGLAASGKSSTFATMKKINRIIKVPMRNHHISSSLGYTWTGIKLMLNHAHERVVWDRVPFNNVTWHQIWYALALCGTDNVSEAAIRSWSTLARRLVPINELYGALFNTIIVVDSDETRAQCRLFQRAHGSDKIRSQWKAYVRIQNYFYAHMHVHSPHLFCLVDLANFQSTPITMSRVQLAIRKIVHMYCNNIPWWPLFNSLSLRTFSHLSESGRKFERKRPSQAHIFTSGSKELIKRRHLLRNGNNTIPQSLIALHNFDGVRNIGELWCPSKSGEGRALCLPPLPGEPSTLD